MTCDMLAELIGASRYSIMRYESGETEPSLDDLTRMAEMLEVEPDELYDDYYKFLAYPYFARIKEIRKAKKLTQSKLGTILGVATGSVKRWEGGRHVVTRTMWEVLVQQKLM